MIFGFAPSANSGIIALQGRAEKLEAEAAAQALLDLNCEDLTNNEQVLDDPTDAIIQDLELEDAETTK